MKARPILFSGPMVRALLDGRKTQTRRTIKPQPNNDPAKHHPIAPYRTTSGDWNWVLKATGHGTGDPFPCPYGTPGDLLWVRESWAINMRATDLLKVFYKAHESASHTEMHRLISAEGISQKYQPTWPRFKPSIHMPRWASRITLEITDVRVERLQTISNKDGLAEGFIEMPATGRVATSLAAVYMGNYWYTARHAFQALWSSINGEKSWSDNPWVWVVEFKVHRCNVDELLREKANNSEVSNEK